MVCKIFWFLHFWLFYRGSNVKNGHFWGFWGFFTRSTACKIWKNENLKNSYTNYFLNTLRMPHTKFQTKIVKIETRIKKNELKWVEKDCILLYKGISLCFRERYARKRLLFCQKRVFSDSVKKFWTLIPSTIT